MALADDLMRMSMHTHVLQGTFQTHYNFMRQLLTHPQHVSDRDTMEALKNLSNVVTDLTTVVLDISRALEQIDARSLDAWVRQTAARH